MDENLGRLRALLAVSEHQNVMQAARSLNLSQPAVTKSIRTLEDNLGILLFDRTSRGMIPTVFGETLVRRAKLVFAELRNADMELAALKGLEVGSIAVGTTPIARSVLLPQAIGQLLEISPGLQITVLEGTSASLTSQLRSGDLEFIVGAIIDGGKEDGLVQEAMMEDELAVVARCGHPLSTKKTCTFSDLAKAEWILPLRDSPQRQQFEESFTQYNVELRQNLIVTNSLGTIREVLLESDRLTILSPHRVFHETKAKILDILPIALPETRRPIGVTMRAGASLSPAAETLLQEIRKVGAKISV